MRKHYSLDRGRNGALVCATPPSEPDVRISRIRLSGRWFTSPRTGVEHDGRLQGKRAQGLESTGLASADDHGRD